MNWDKAKNYTIFFLLIINILLLVLNIVDKRDHILTSSQKADIIKILNDEHIVLDCEIPDTFSPMSTLSMEMYEFDLLKMQKIFFGNIDNVVRTDTDDTVEFTAGTDKLQIHGNTFIFTGTVDNITDTEEGRKIADKYKNSISSVFGEYKFVKENRSGNSFYYEYNEKYNKYNIFINNILIYINNGKIAVKGSYYDQNEKYTVAEDIISADEALFCALDEIRKSYDNGCSISDIELGYFYNNVLNNKKITAMPTYKITVSDNVVFYVNGYNGSVEKI